MNRKTISGWWLNHAESLNGAAIFCPNWNAIISLLAVLLAIGLSPGLAFAEDNIAWLRTTFNNPIPTTDGVFGGSVAGVGSDKILVGSEGTAKAYLFDADGALLKTFPMPDPKAGSFGATVGALGGDRVLIGAYNYPVGINQAGAAYLFNTNGNLLTTFTNPSPASIQAFGWLVTAMGNDRVLIAGFPNPNQGVPYAGSVYLYNTNGTVLTHFNNPTPAQDSGIGTAIAAVGSDRVLIGAPYNSTGANFSGVAYLFSTNGTLLTTFTNSIPADNDNFGMAVAAVGTKQVLISAIDSGGVQGTGGAAYLFNTKGTLLTTFTNPTPAVYDNFGFSVAAVGSTRVIIGAYQDGTGEFQAGSAYLFSTNGTLLSTITNPTPAHQDWFAWSVAALGTDGVIIGGVWDDTGATDSGSAYLYGLPYPQLNISANATGIFLSWVSPEAGLILQETDRLDASVSWNATTNVMSVNGLTNSVQQPIENVSTSRFYRLHRP